MKRREFCRTMLGAIGACSYALLNPMRPLYAFSPETACKTLLVLFQRGGCDGLNTVVPFGDGAYFDLRPTIGIAAPNGNSDSAINLGGFFGLHPALSSFMPIFNNGDLAVLPATHYPNASRSHFDSQHFIESSASIADRANKDELDGWLNRHMATLNRDGQLRAISFGNSLAQSLRGDVDVSTFNNLSNFNLGLDENIGDSLISRLIRVYDQTPLPDTSNRRATTKAGEVALNNLDVINTINGEAYIPANGAVYPSNGYGNQLRQAAQLIKSNVGLEVCTISHGGYDTHGNQGGANGNHANRLRDFSNGIAAIYQDLGPRMSDVMILTMTEFGRTARENGSAGTDHGNASSWFLVGGGSNINSGIYGDWPGLDSNQLYNGRYLNMAVDYRNVIGEILTNFIGNPELGVVFTGDAADANDPDSPLAYAPLGIVNASIPV